MSELVNDYRKPYRKKEKSSKPTQDNSSRSPGKSPSDPMGSQPIQKHNLSSEVDNSSFERMIEHELSGANRIPANDVGGNAKTLRTDRGDPQDEAEQKIAPTYFDLIKEQQREHVVPVEETNQDLIGELARSLNGREQFVAPEFEENLETRKNLGKSSPVYQRQNSQTSGFWTWRVTLGSALVLTSVIAAGVLVKDQGLPGVFEQIVRVAQAAKSTLPEVADFKTEKTFAEASVEEQAVTGALLPDKRKSFDALSVTEFVNPPKSIVTESTAEVKQQDDAFDRVQIQTLNKQTDVERDIEIENLKAELKVMRARLSSLQLAFNTANAGSLSVQPQQVAKAESEVSSLEDKIATLKQPQNLVQTTGKVSKVAISDGITETPKDINLAIAPPLTQPIIPKPRDPKTVELALSSSLGLLLLKPDRRARLKTKLINGDCLAPALSSVFSQVPVLVMRDMVRQLDDQCSGFQNNKTTE